MIAEIKQGLKSNFLIPVLSDVGMGYIHSIYENTFNIIFEGTLIHFGEMQSSVSAFGMLIPSRDLKAIMAAIEREDRVKIQAGTLTIYAQNKTWKIKTTSFKQVDCLVPSMDLVDQTFLKELLKKLLSLSIEKRTGVITSEEELIFINKLVDTKWEDECFQKSFISHFIGRGIGLTPSGDDMLMGILMMNQSLRFNENWKETLMEQLKKIKTTEVSMAYYKALSEGYTSSFFVDFLQAIKEKNLTNWDELINQISKYGHTSGWDTLYGIQLFLQKWIKYNETVLSK
ncbi:DUF2877 domain-containing protein [Jeotgalibaca sp. MA1X17-3]|uniref:DUF2877 domain-containing protein n=1 Tax=Jeotgalibaca sp. MA1X17-3 TaxID=2908211 RepID=UPI001F225B19|nr:DUF2877 domain-containing protein [Jeotgalibaca sp. MA1X17-3]UJF16162.1 DUF2877 domain-containing protein [Jeotgalibaca sp. MA1X17-3]